VLQENLKPHLTLILLGEVKVELANFEV
jgi:hypothetical protein